MKLHDDLVRVAFETDPRGLGGGSPERLWAKRAHGDEKELFEIQNSPFYAKGVSYLDIVEAAGNSSNPGEFKYCRTMRASGHSTYRLLVPKNVKLFLNRWKQLEELGCTYEFADAGTNLLYAVDVPAKTNVFNVYALLEKGEEDSVWLFDEGHCGHPIERAN